MKKAFGKFISWIAGPKSDFILFVIALVLLNVVGARAFFRVDLTPQQSYSLSSASREAVRTIEEPLSVKVFFSANLPAPYNSVERYLRDLLVEYKGAANGKFSCEFFDMSKKENQELARSWGIGMSRIQELKDNEVGIKDAYMGLVLSYADGVELLDNLSTTEGLEYKLTTTIGKMIATTNVLSGLSGKVSMRLYTSPDLSKMGVGGMKNLERDVGAICERLNKKYRDRLEFSVVATSTPADVDAAVTRYGLHKISWSDRKDGSETGTAALGVVLEYGDRFRTVPLDLARDIFGGWGIAGLDKLETGLSDNLQGLMSRSTVIGYVNGHGEKSLQDERRGAAHFASITRDMYELRDLNLTQDAIPPNMEAIVINGPRTAFTDAELYNIDQFLMRGGNVLAMVDPYDEKMPEGQLALYGGQPTYEPVNTGLERLLAKYGVTPDPGYVLDKNCYIARQQGQADMPVYYAPLLAKESLNAKNAAARNLAYVVFLQSGSLSFDAKNQSSGRTIVSLADSSAESWIMKDNVSLMPFAMQPPPAGSMSKKHLAVLAEGSFESAFASAPSAITPKDDGSKAGAAKDVIALVSSEAHLAKSVQPGRLIVIGTSAITTSGVMDTEGREPISIFVRNCVDLIGGKSELIDMRTKGLALNTLGKSAPAARIAARAVNLYGLPALIALAGLLAWRIRARRRRAIEARYADRIADRYAELQANRGAAHNGGNKK